MKLTYKYKTRFYRLLKSGSVILFLTLGLFGCKDESVEINYSAPELATFNLQDQQIKLDDLKGKPILLEFWQVQCGPCIAIMPTLEKLSQKYKEKLTVVSVNIDPNTPDLDFFIKKFNLSYMMLRDQLSITQNRYNVVGTPTKFFIDKNGITHSKHLGYSSMEELEQFIKPLI